MPDEKDRFGDKLRDLEHAREDQYFAKRDRELIEKLRHQQELKHPGVCPTCGATLDAVEEGIITGRVCSAGHGIWLTPKELETVTLADDGQAVARLVARLMRH